VSNSTRLCSACRGSASVKAALSADGLAALQTAGLGDLGGGLLRRIEHDRHEIDWRDAKLEMLSFEMAQLKRLKFDRKSEQLDVEQGALFDNPIDAEQVPLM